ncbi:hypothetical protein [uncultured Pseudokineococcus sp.]|uniref:hypothetical protein n=1 Tax=uncultured Pseudokineococcus sp. TaxID=1642928 RepID=UPI00262F0143|nr:hypothetical protein [uncultured Pseudokineococcus sp.]
MTLLVLGYAVLALVVVLVVTAASAVHLERKRVWAAADAAAADAADAVDEAAYYGQDGLSGGVPLTDAAVRAAAEDHLRRRAAWDDLDGVVLGPGTGTPDGRTAQVQLVARVDVPVLSLLPGARVAGGPLTVVVTSRARTFLDAG